MAPLIELRATTATAVELTSAEASLYGSMDRIRQAVNSTIRRYVNANRELLTGRVLDYGAGKEGTCRIPMPFRELIDPEQYVPWDLGDAAIAPNSRLFHGILCTQVIQAVDDPFTLFRQFAGWLKYGGHLVLTYPVAWPEIEEERWRFTQKGVWALCHQAGLKIIDHQTLSSITIDGHMPFVLMNGCVARREQ